MVAVKGDGAVGEGSVVADANPAANGDIVWMALSINQRRWIGVVEVRERRTGRMRAVGGDVVGDAGAGRLVEAECGRQFMDSTIYNSKMMGGMWDFQGEAEARDIGGWEHH